MRLTALTLLSFVACLSACGPTTQQCGPENCGGCCAADGTCQPGNTANRCGEGGDLCASCSGAQVCADHVCVAPVACNATNCPTGCCASDGTCHMGTDNAQCGTGGASCDACTGNETCVAQACAAPVCNATTCPSGCCGSDGTCHAGTGDTQCGTGGASCETCGGGEVCQQQTCATPATAITAPNETWTWAPFPNAVCGNGASTGIGVNLTTRSTDVLLYLQGGGACWDIYTCGLLHTATYTDTGYGSADFAGDGTKNAAPFSRATANNPFKDMSYVYVPYCTGDVHAGDAVTVYPAATGNPPVPQTTVHHKGAANMRAYLARLAVTFPNATRVFISGSSAGAFGAQFNFNAVKAAFPNAEIHVLADCGQMVNPAGTRLGDWVTAWNLQVPAGCTGCLTDFTKYPDWLFANNPQSRFGLLAYTQDNVLSQFFGYSGADYETQTRALLSSDYDGTSNARYYLVGGNSHVMMGDLQTITNNGVTLRDWSAAFVSGTGWASVSPP